MTMKPSTVFMIFGALAVATIVGAVVIARKTGGKLVVYVKTNNGSAVSPHNVAIIKGRSGPAYVSPLQKKITDNGSVIFENLEIGEYYYIAVLTNKTGVLGPEISNDVVLINSGGNLLSVVISEA